MERLDKELVKRNLALNRTKAQELVLKGLVFCNGKQILKPSVNIKETDNLEVKENNLFKYVSRGGFKLEKALNVFNINLQNKVVLDIGSSTGGFTDCALQNGAKKVIAIDVGTNLMDQTLRENKKIDLFENTNIKNVSDEVFKQIDVIVTDVSFISLENAFQNIVKNTQNFEIVCLIKPQFECGKEIAKQYKGIVLNEKIHSKILNNVIDFFNAYNYSLINLDFSPIKGGDGNIEYLAYFKREMAKKSIDINLVISNAFKNKF